MEIEIPWRDLKNICISVQDNYCRLWRNYLNFVLVIILSLRRSLFIIVLWLPVTLFAYSNNNATGINEQLSHSSVWTVLQDSRGLMWFGTKDGLNLYNGYTNTVFRNIPGDSSSIGNNFIRSLYEDPETKEIWVGTDDGLFIYNPETSTFRAFSATLRELISAWAESGFKL